MPFKNWVAGDRVYAADVMSFLMNQAVIVCANAAARPASPVKGMTVYQSDVDQLQAWNGSAWVRLPSAGTIVNADINAAAAIAYSKLNLANSITSADIVDGTIVNADINASAAIAFSKLGTPPVYRVRRAAAQSLTSTVAADISFDTQDANNCSMGYAAPTITVPSGLGGMWTVSGRVLFSSGASAGGYVSLLVSGVTYTQYISSGNSNVAVGGAFFIGDLGTIKMTAYYSNGTALTATANLEMVRIGSGL